MITLLRKPKHRDVNWLTPNLVLLTIVFTPILICYLFGIFQKNVKARHKYMSYLTRIARGS